MIKEIRVYEIIGNHNTRTIGGYDYTRFPNISRNYLSLKKGMVRLPNGIISIFFIA